MNKDNIDEHIGQLKRKRDVEIPATLAKLRKEIEQEGIDFDKEMNCLERRQREKHLWDIPVVVWDIIAKKFITPVNDLRSLALASPKLNDFISQGGVCNKIHLTGELVFSLLVKNQYMNWADLQKCKDASSDELSMFTSTSLRYVNCQDFKFRQIILSTSEEVHQFCDVVDRNKEDGKIWDAFTQRSFTFRCGENMNKNDAKMYWKSVNKLLKTYGKYILNIEIYENSKDRATQFLNHVYLGNLPNLQYFRAWYNRSPFVFPDPSASSSLSLDRSRERLLQHKRNRPISVYVELTSEADPKTGQKSFALKSPSLASRRIRPFVSKASVLLSCFRNEISVTPEQINNTEFDKVTDLELLFFRNADMTQNNVNHLNINPDQLKKLTLKSHKPISSLLEFILRIPSLKEVTIEMLERHLRAPAPWDFRINPGLVILRVTTFTYVWNSANSGQTFIALHSLAMAFPSLRRLSIKSNVTKKRFINEMKTSLLSEKGDPLENHRYNVYQLYSMALSLIDSNIWTHRKALNVLTIATLVEEGKASPLSIEKYTRIDYERVVFESTVQNVACENSFDFGQV